MKITFLGATKTVTGSNFLVEASGKKFLVDCGMYQGQAEEEWENSAPFAFDVNEIDFMLLTHAHIDHSGRIPKLYKEGYRNKIYATKATCDLCSIMLPDSGHIQEMEIEWKNRKRVRKGLDPQPPLYTAQEAMECLEVFEPVKYDEIIDISDNIHVRFNDAGHMLGSAIIEIWAEENGKTTKAVFTGDLGNNDIPLLSSPTMIDDTDYLVMESTYGGRLHNRNDDKAEIFLNIVAETLNKGGTVVIPSFAVGRTQEILYELNNLKDQRKSDEEFVKKYQKLMSVPVYVDSPLAISATEIFKENMDIFDEETQAIIKSGDNPLEFNGLQFTKTAEESKALNEKNESSIIISASGMCEVGRIKHHLKHNLWRPESTILFVGYQAIGTLGRKIVDGAKTVKIFGEEIGVNAQVKYIEAFSGHADQRGLLKFVESFKKRPMQIYLVHGDEEAQNVLAGKIGEEFNIPVDIPMRGDVYEVSDYRISKVGELKSPNEYKFIRLELLQKLENLRDELDDMTTYLNADLKKETTDEEIAKKMERLSELEKQIVEVIK